VLLQAEIRAIFKKVSENRQTLLFSATLPAALAQFARAGYVSPLCLSGKAPPPVEFGTKSCC
jgi:superfamily II DNA/RNA helicase